MRTRSVLRRIPKRQIGLLLAILAVVALLASPMASQDVQERPIVFESERDGQWEIYVMSPDGSNQKRLTHSQRKEVQNRLPGWCDHGKKIVFVSNRDRANRGSSLTGAVRWDRDLYAMNADGSHVRRLTNFSTGGSSYPACSPDGSQISFLSTHESSQELYVMGLDGSRVRRLTTRAGEEEGSDWSPDGGMIAFDGTQDEVFDLYLIRSTGRDLRRLTHTPAHQRGSESPDWSPDGKRIVFHSDREGKREVYVMNVDGSDVRRLTRTPGRDAISWQARWSPNGKQITFVSDRDGNWQTNREIYVMNADGSNVRRLTFNDARDNHPDW